MLVKRSRVVLCSGLSKGIWVECQNYLRNWRNRQKGVFVHVEILQKCPGKNIEFFVGNIRTIVHEKMYI